MLEIILGCGWIGAIAVPINTAAMGPQIGYYLTNSDASLFAIEAQFVERAFKPIPATASARHQRDADGDNDRRDALLGQFAAGQILAAEARKENA